LIVGVDLLWRVELELSAWRGSHPIKLRRLRRVLGRDAEIVRARNVSSHLLLRSAGATITVEVIADSPGAAARCAERAVERALVYLGESPTASAWIVSTDGDLPPAAGARRRG
jgi:hypothetical protein